MQTCSLEPVERVVFESSPQHPEIDEYGSALLRFIDIHRAWEELRCLGEFLSNHPMFDNRLVRLVDVGCGTRYIDDDRGYSMRHHATAFSRLAMKLTRKLVGN